MEPLRYDAGEEVNASLGVQVPSKIKQKIWKRNIPAVLMLLPIMIFIVVFFLVPMLYVFYLSFIQGNDLNAIKVVYTLQNYASFFKDPFYVHSLWITIKISFYTVVVCLFLGYPVAYTLMECSPRMRGIVSLLVASPLLVSIVVRNFGWYLLLSPKGTINQLLMDLGITNSPLKLLFNEIGVVIGLSNAYLPFMILAIATSLYNIDPSLVKASAILGASPFRSFLSITLPLSLPGIISGSVLVFSLSMSAYVTPTLMGGANIPVIPVVMYDQMIHLLKWTYGSAMSYILLGITLIVVTVVTRLFERGRFKEVFR